VVTFRLLGFREQRKEIATCDYIDKKLNITLSEEAHELGMVVVTAGRHEQRIEDVTVSMEVVKPAFIENTNATNMESVIDQVPGVNVIDGQANIRGGAGWSYGAGSRVLVLVDDLPQISADAGDAKWGLFRRKISNK
jgi:iron complex outermembrane receptor protein